MNFVKLSADYIKSGYTQVDNLFLLSYLPSADPINVKIYLFGLALALNSEEQDNDLQKIALSLHLSEQRVVEGFAYWESLGLVSVSKASPFDVKYLSVKHPLTPSVKYKATDFASFVEEVNRLFPDKILSPNEFNAFFELMTVNKMESNAMLLIMQYCNDYKGGKVSTPYILAVANDWVGQGLTKYADVEVHIQELENNVESIRSIFRAMGIKRSAEIEDRQLYLKWTNQYNYTLDAILTACKALKKRGGMEKLDAFIGDLYKAKAFTSVEIAQFSKAKEENYQLTIDVIKNLGAYYGSIEVVTENYIVPWLNQGFEPEALLLSSKFCFLRNIRTMDGLEQMISKFFRKGLLTADGIEQYISRQVNIDSNIKTIFAISNYIGNVSNKDRESYRLWKEWGLTDEVIAYVAELNKNKPFPMQSINRMLSSLHNLGINTVDGAKKELSKVTTAPQPKEEFLRHNYTEEELKGVLLDFDDWN